MLEKVDLTRAIPKEEYKTRLPALQASLYELQLALRRRACPASSSSKAGRQPARAPASTCSPAAWSRAPSACT